MLGPLLAAFPAVAPHAHEGDAQAVTSLIGPASGGALADGRYVQEVTGGILRIESRLPGTAGRAFGPDDPRGPHPRAQRQPGTQEIRGHPTELPPVAPAPAQRSSTRQRYQLATVR